MIVEVKDTGLELEFPDGTPDSVVADVVRRESKKYRLEQERQTAQKEVETAESFIGAVDKVTPVVEATMTPLGIARSAGAFFTRMGDITGGAVEDTLIGQPSTGGLFDVPNPFGQQFWHAVTGEPSRSQADTPMERGLVQAGELLPVIAGGMLGQAAGIPAPVSFGLTAGAYGYKDALRHGADEGTALLAGAETALIGAAAPGVAGLGYEGAAAALGLAVRKGLLRANQTLVQKGVESLAGQGAVTTFIEGLNVHRYMAMPPEERKEAIQQSLWANTAFFGMEVPGLLSKGPSRTQVERVRVGEVMEELAKRPDSFNELLKAIDEEVVAKAAREEVEATPDTPLGPDGKPLMAPGEAEPEPGNRPLGTPVVPVGTLPPLQKRFWRRTRLERVRQSYERLIEAVGGLSPIHAGRMGRHGRKAAGYFAPHTEDIRLRDWKDVTVASHEVAHAIDHNLWQKPKRSAGYDRAVRAELVKLGHDLYGSQRPHNGYASEGFAEFIRFYMTSEAVPKAAPQTYKWFTEKVLAGNKRLAREMARACRETDIWRSMGPEGQGSSQMRAHTGPLRRTLEQLRRTFSYQGLVEGGAPLQEFSKRAVKEKPELADRPSPFEMFFYHRGRAGSVIQQMAREGMIDIWSNPTGGRSLQEALGPVLKGVRLGRRSKTVRRFEEFLYGLRAQEVLEQGMDPGISREQADALVKAHDSPAFRLAADGYNRWGDGVLDYISQASPQMRLFAEAARQRSKHYAPLARDLDAVFGTVKPGVEGRLASPSARLHGSPRGVLNIGAQTLLSAERLIAAAHWDQVMDQLLTWAKLVPGMSKYIVKVPTGQRKIQVTLAKLREQLEAQGVDLSAVADDTLLSFYQAAQRPGGADPIVIRNGPSGPEWYQVDRRLFEAIAGIEPTKLSPWQDWLLGKPARMAKMGMTGLRASFQLVTNPQRDFPAFMSQSMTRPNPLRRAADYMVSLGEVGRMLLPGAKTPPVLKAFLRNGALSMTFTGSDVQAARREARNLFRPNTWFGRVVRHMTTPIESTRELLGFMEIVPRLAEFRGIGREMNWKPGQPLTPLQAVRMNNAAQMVTTPFKAHGDFGGDTWVEAFVRGAPFTNASIQGARAFVRKWHNRPLEAFLAAIAGYLTPTIALWMLNRDEDWYRAMPDREKWLYWHFAVGGTLIQVPKPVEWGLFFSAIPEGLLDAAYREDPKTTDALLGHSVQMLNPLEPPTLANLTAEQLKNRVFFWDRPIVPAGQERLLPGEQVAPYTSWYARELGRLFPNTLSPRRVDHAVRALMGGAIPDALDSLGIEGKLERRGAELSDIPIVGRLFRRGGTFSGRSKPLEELYDLHIYWDGRIRSEDYPPNAREAAYARLLRRRIDVVQTFQKLAEASNDPEQRRDMYRRLSARAQELVDEAKAAGLMGPQVVLPPPRPARAR